MSSLVAKIYSGFTFVATCTVNTKVDMRFNVKQAYWLSDRIRERIMQMVCHCHLLSFKEFMILLIVCLRDKN